MIAGDDGAEADGGGHARIDDVVEGVAVELDHQVASGSQPGGAGSPGSTLAQRWCLEPARLLG
jgi:hypothetical protein